MDVANRESRGKLRRWWSIWVVGGVDHAAVLNQISEDSGWSGRYLFLVLISASISLLGLLMPSVAVLIGAMLLSPLMMPIIGLGFGIATLDFREIRRAATALGLGSAVAVVLSVILISLSPVQTITSEIAGRTQPTLFDLLVALLSAVAGAYALVRGRGGTVVGVAIAIALMPPLVVVGFGLATWNWTIFSGALLLFITNAVTISLTAALVARVYGFGSHLSPHHTGWQLILFFAALGLLSVPLSSALRQIAFEAVAQRQVRDTVRARFPSEARLSQVEIDYARSPIRVRAVMLTPGVVPSADALIAADLRTRLGRPIDIHVDQLRTSLDIGATEAAQIARATDAGRQDIVSSQDQARTKLSLIAGIEPSAIRMNPEQRSLTATAATLPDLGLDGYQALEERARRTLPEWSVMLAPPEDAKLPAVRIDQGVVDGKLLDLAAWGSARKLRELVMDGGTSAQRRAIADGIVSRGGKAVTGTGGGVIRLRWAAAPDTSPEDQRRATISDPGQLRP